MSRKSPYPKSRTFARVNASPFPKLPRGSGKRTKYPEAASAMLNSPSEGHVDCTAAPGPPCTETTRGYFFAGSNPAGYTSQPCTSNESDFQRMHLPSPHAGFTFLLRCVICFQLPALPVHTAGAFANELRTAANVLPSLESETEGPQVPADT